MALTSGYILRGKNHYRIIKKLGEGAAGTVYLVEDGQENSLVAKEVDFSAFSDDKKGAEELFEKEAYFMSLFDHNGIPKIIEYFKKENNAYLIMEYVKGHSLEDIIVNKARPFSRKQAVKWTIELTDIMDYLHNSFEKPVVYRDLKPSNIMITSDNEIKLIDFGISRYYNPDKDTDTMRLGTPGYAAPEQFKGRGQSCPQTDIYALGVILYQMLTKHDPTVEPFRFPPIKKFTPFVPPELEKIVMRAIELKPLKRYISMQEFKEDLEKYTGAREGGELIKPTSSSGISRDMVAAILMLCFLFAFIITYFLYFFIIAIFQALGW